MKTLTKQTVYLPVKVEYGLKTELIQEEGYFFTPEQLNEYTANVIKQALETAAENAKVVKDLGEDLNGTFVFEVTKYYYVENGYPIYTDKESITNTFEETFKQFEV